MWLLKQTHIPTSPEGEGFWREGISDTPPGASWENIANRIDRFDAYLPSPLGEGGPLAVDEGSSILVLLIRKLSTSFVEEPVFGRDP